ncbi:hypothetical protein ACI65C_001468 [Semiaphis heraclei]
MYVQNWSICLIEIGFIVRCFGLFQKFQIINEELVVLKTETISKNKYPIVLQNKVQSDVTNSPQFQTLANTIELLRMKHQFVRGALRDLNKLYGTQLGSSLVFLFILILFDIYGEVNAKDVKTTSKIFIYGWILQYTFRCFAIIITSHFTIKQAYNAKMLIADINNRYLDKTTKEENMSMYCVETHFTVLCFILYQKFVGINKDLMALKIDTVVRNKYPFKLRAREKCGKNINNIDYNRDILQTLAAGHSMANFVEQIKVKHRLAREAVKNLNDFFGVQLGLSMCSLCLFSMFDLYYHIRGIMNPTKSNILIYGWILQYSVRFGSITILAHLTSKQALKSKILITDVCNRYLDKNTKEEIQLFLNQMCSCAIEFTACDFFTLNTHLITSVC